MHQRAPSGNKALVIRERPDGAAFSTCERRCEAES